MIIWSELVIDDVGKAKLTSSYKHRDMDDPMLDSTANSGREMPKTFCQRISMYGVEVAF